MSEAVSQNEFLLEVGTEEIPAGMMESALADLQRLLAEGFRRLRLSEGAPVSLEMYGTPRRLVAYCPSLIARQPSSLETVQGPPRRVAFDAEGKPAAAALSFAAKMGAKVEKLETVSTPKGEYLVFRKRDPGRPTRELLRELAPQAVLGISFPRSMHWEGKAGPRFIRPIRSLLVLYGGRVVPCAIGTVAAGTWTFGHRLLGKPRLRVKDFATYREALRNNYVLLDPKERRARILEGIQTLLGANNGSRLKPNEELLNTLVYLAEYPTALLGEFDPAFLALPQEVLITVMKGHQKYLSVEQADRSLAPRFVAVMDLDEDRAGLIRHGHERVLRARFNDARFFWETDGKIRLEDRLEMLKNVTFQANLGSYYDKAMRMQKLAESIWLMLRMTPYTVNEASHDAVLQAARLAKCDLTTDLVKEFTELQGIVGGLSAKREGLSDENAAAIYDHYKPQSMEDALPRSREVAVVSLTDRIDTLVGCFGVGLASTGSKDPFGLRRAAQGVIRILAELALPLKLDDLVAKATAIYDDARAHGQVLWQQNTSSLLAFFHDRLSYYLREVRGFPFDEVNAVLGADVGYGYDVFDVLERVVAVHDIRPTENFEPLAVAFKRMKNILQQARKSGNAFVAQAIRKELLELRPETQLYERYEEIREKVVREKCTKNYYGALEAISSLRPDVDLFFDKILVMDPNPELRKNRLNLLDALLKEFSTIADFSQIVTAEEKKAGVQ